MIYIILIINKINIMKKLKNYRYYQKETDNNIYNELQKNNKCIVKMFCGTGKSLIMKKCKINKNQNLIVYVFPSLALIEQFNTDYMFDFDKQFLLKISSEDDSTTNPKHIKTFLKIKENKIILITYQSFNVLLDNLKKIKIDICHFDEAHHSVGETYQNLIFENELIKKQIFYTATPKNTNGIQMYDKEDLEDNMCGNLVYDYSYLKGTLEDYLNPFTIQLDFYVENSNNSIFETIARTVLSTKNNRVLTFHADVNTDRDYSVINFVNQNNFIISFNKILNKEFPDKKELYKKITFIALHAGNSKERKQILNDFDNTEDNEIFIISSCETIGEGVDTKNANMCVFVDPKSSYVKIIQNIGRIVRKQYGIKKDNSTILIPCWVNKEKYSLCNNDVNKCDELIREDLSKGGNWNGILNVLSALKQEDPEIYDICLNYPNTYSPTEIKANIKKQGFKIIDKINNGELVKSLNYLDNTIQENDYKQIDNEDDKILKISKNVNKCIEIHTNSIETPIEYYNKKNIDNGILRLYKTTENDKNIYQPIVNKENNINDNEKINKPRKKNRFNINPHTNDDVKVLWNIKNFNVNKDINSCIIDCEVIFKKDKWKNNLQSVKEYIDKYDKTPSTIDKNKEMKILGSWLSTQKTNYNEDIPQS